MTSHKQFQLFYAHHFHLKTKAVFFWNFIWCDGGKSSK